MPLSYTGYESSSWGVPEPSGDVTVRLRLRGDFDNPALEFVSVYLNGTLIGTASSGVSCVDSQADITISGSYFSLLVPEGYATIRIVASSDVGYDCQGSLGSAQANLSYTRKICNTQVLQSSSLPVSGSEFGVGLAMSDDAMLIGASVAAGSSAPAAGAVDAYRKTSTGAWQLNAHITAPDGQSGDKFGRAIATHRNLAVIGAPYRDTPAGADSGGAYAIERAIDGQWSEPMVIAPAALDADDLAGWAVAAFDDWIFIGIPRSNFGATDSGRLAVFHSDGLGGWIEVQSLQSPALAAGDRFGEAVTVDGGRLFVGAPRDDVGTVSNQGSVHEFVEVDGLWIHSAQITAPDGAANDLFGEAVSSDGNSLLISAQGRDISGVVNCGCAYTCTLASDGTWLFGSSPLVSANIEAEARFGWHLAVSGPRAVIGAWNADIGPEGSAIIDAGSAEVFIRRGNGSWNRQAVLTADIAGAFDTYGRAIALHGTSLAVSAPMSDIGGGASGMVFIYSLSADCNENGIDDALEISGDATRDCNNNGWLDSCEIIDEPALDLNNDGRLDMCHENVDLNHDGLIDGHDLSFLLAAWGTPIGDIDGDGLTNGDDLSLLLSNWH